MLSAAHVSVSRGGRRLLDDVSLQVEPGQIHALIGANGAGKSSLLRVLAGELLANAGAVSLNARPLASYAPAALARQRAVLTQHDELRFAYTGEEVVALGRLAASRGSAAEEAALLARCLADTDASHLASRLYTQLSGGERARVQLARVLAQVSGPLPRGEGSAARYLLLDEPTAALDIAHQHGCLLLARQLAAKGLGVLVALHDLNLAAHYADAVSLLKDGRLLASGSVDEVMTPALLAKAFGSQMRFTRITALGRMQLLAEVAPADLGD